jgi:hypothetical protein
MFLGLYPNSAVLLLVALPLLMVKLDDGWECAVLVCGGWRCGMKGSTAELAITHNADIRTWTAGLQKNMELREKEKKTVHER